MEESDPYDCPATFEAAGLGCALMTGHDNGWHWDERGVDWREEPGIEPVFGGPVTDARPERYAGEREELEWLAAHAPYMSPEAKRRREELRAPEVAAVKAAIEDEVIRPAMGLRARSCPSCHSIGPVRDGCADSWHSGDTTGISAP